MSENVVRTYLRYLKLERNFSPNTVVAYAHDLDIFMAYLGREGLDVATVNHDNLEHFASTLHEMGIGPRSQARVLSGVRSFFRYLILDGYVKDDPTELIEWPRNEVHLPEFLTTAEVDRIKDALNPDKAETQRNRAIIEILFSCGLRVSELVNLKISNLDLSERFLKVCGKGRKERLVPMSPCSVNELESWFTDRSRLDIKKGEEDYVFLNRRGHHLTRTMVLIMIKKAAADAGIKKTISPHTFRHSFATALLKGGADLRIIQELLGHEDISTTEIYTHIDDDDLRKAILEHHPRNMKV